MAYAEGTSVPVAKSRVEIETALKKAGATGFMYGWDDAHGEAHLACRLAGLLLRFKVRKPRLEDVPYNNGKKGRSLRRIPDAVRMKMVDAEERRRWRALLLIVKAKLEIVRVGQSTYDREFLADVALPDGSTVAEQLIPKIRNALAEGKLPKLLLGPGGA